MAPQSLDEARATFRQQKNMIVQSLSAIAGSRWLLAILATFALAFGTHLAFAPTRLPTVGGLSLAQSGLPPSVDFGFAGEQAQAARDAAIRQGGAERVRELIAANPERIPLYNAIGFAAALLLTFGNLWIMTKRRSFISRVG